MDLRMEIHLGENWEMNSDLWKENQSVIQMDLTKEIHLDILKVKSMDEMMD